MSDHLQATVIRVDGTKESISLPEKSGDRLKALQELVGGYIEVVPLKDGGYMVIHKEEKLKSHLLNDTATALVQIDGWVSPQDYIAGVAVIVDEEALQ